MRSPSNLCCPLSSHFEPINGFYMLSSECTPGSTSLVHFEHCDNLLTKCSMWVHCMHSASLQDTFTMCAACAAISRTWFLQDHLDIATKKHGDSGQHVASLVEGYAHSSDGDHRQLPYLVSHKCTQKVFSFRACCRSFSHAANSLTVNSMSSTCKCSALVGDYYCEDMVVTVRKSAAWEKLLQTSLQSEDFVLALGPHQSWWLPVVIILAVRAFFQQTGHIVTIVMMSSWWDSGVILVWSSVGYGHTCRTHCECVLQASRWYAVRSRRTLGEWIATALNMYSKNCSRHTFWTQYRKTPNMLKRAAR